MRWVKRKEKEASNVYGSYAAIRTFDVIESLQSHLQSSAVAATPERKCYGRRERGRRKNDTLSSRCLFEPFVTKMCRLCLLYLQSWSKLQNFQAKTDFSRFQQNIFVSCWIKFVLFFVGFHLFVKDLIDWLSPNFWSPSFRMSLIIKSTHQS